RRHTRSDRDWSSDVCSSDLPGRLVFMSLFATALGLAGGAAAWVLVRLIALLTNAALLHEYGWNLPSFRHFHPGPDLILVAMAARSEERRVGKGGGSCGGCE